MAARKAAASWLGVNGDGVIGAGAGTGASAGAGRGKEVDEVVVEDKEMAFETVAHVAAQA
jgi:hypothetical protein